MMNPKYTKIFEPIQIGHLVVKNRIETAPAAPRLASAEGLVTPELIEWSRVLAKGGAGIVTVGFSGVKPFQGHNGSFCLNLGSDMVIPGLGVLADSIHRYGAVASIELAGFAGGGQQPQGKSPIDLMTQEEIDEWISYFAAAAERALFSGMDMIQLHGGHGLVVSNFFSPLLNHRTDHYGGSISNRARFACELLDAIRAKVGRKLAIEFRLSAEEIISGGVELAETIEFAKIIQDKIDLLHVSAGFMPINELVPITTQPIYLKRGYNVHYAAAIKKAGLKIPVTAVGSIGLDLAAEIIEKGEADICSMARTVIADPESVNKARIGKEAEIRPCIRCVTCLNRTHGSRPLRVACSVNPCSGRELELRDLQINASHSKKVVVIGGGPAGMEAARTAASRGHRVVLMEKSERLGGTLHMAVSADFKADLKSYLEWAVLMTMNHPGVEIQLGREATPELVKAENPDAVVVALGAEGSIPQIPGLDSRNVVWVGDVEAGKAEVGDRVIVAGGGLTGCEAALSLVHQGKEVTIVEMVGAEEMLSVSLVPMTALIKLLNEAGVKILTRHKLIESKNNAVTLEDTDGRSNVNISFDTLVVSLGVRPRAEEAAKFMGLADEVFMIGDCTTSRGNLYTATTQGYNAGLNI